MDVITCLINFYMVTGSQNWQNSMALHVGLLLKARVVQVWRRGQTCRSTAKINNHPQVDPESRYIKYYNNVFKKVLLNAVNEMVCTFLTLNWKINTYNMSLYTKRNYQVKSWIVATDDKKMLVIITPQNET